jgi:hypothetical protein
MTRIPSRSAPVELAVRLIEMELLRRECAAGCDDEPAIAAIEVGAFDRAVVPAGNAHVGPVDVTRFHVDDDPVGMRTVGRDDVADASRPDPSTGRGRR